MNITYKVYILQSEKDDKFYIGCTSKNLNERIQYHNSGYVKSTKNRRPLKLIYYETYKNKSDAFKREFYLKKPQGYKEKLFILKSCKDLAQPRRGPFP